MLTRYHSSFLMQQSFNNGLTTEGFLMTLVPGDSFQVN